MSFSEKIPALSAEQRKKAEEKASKVLGIEKERAAFKADGEREAEAAPNNDLDVLGAEVAEEQAALKADGEREADKAA